MNKHGEEVKSSVESKGNLKFNYRHMVNSIQSNNLHCSQLPAWGIILS